MTYTDQFSCGSKEHQNDLLDVGIDTSRARLAIFDASAGAKRRAV